MVGFMLYSIKGVLFYLPNCLACIIKNSNKQQYQFLNIRCASISWNGSEIKEPLIVPHKYYIHMCIFVDVQWYLCLYTLLNSWCFLIRLIALRKYDSIVLSLEVLEFRYPVWDSWENARKLKPFARRANECEINKLGNTNNKYTYYI